MVCGAAPAPQSITFVCLHGLWCSSRAPKYHFCVLTWFVVQPPRPKVSLLCACMVCGTATASQGITFVCLHGLCYNNRVTNYQFCKQTSFQLHRQSKE